MEKVNYKIPSADLLTNLAKSNELIEENNEVHAQTLEFLEQRFAELEVDNRLIGANITHNYIQLTYGVLSFNQELCQSAFVIAKKIEEKLKEYLFSEQVIVLRKTGRPPYPHYLYVCIQNRNKIQFPLRETFEGLNLPLKDDSLCFYATPDGIPVLVDSEKLALTTICSQNLDDVVCFCQTMLLSATFSKNSGSLQFIIFDESETFYALNGLPHNHFGFNVKDYNKVFACLDYLEKIANKREQILKKENTTFKKYNAKHTDNPLPLFFVVINEFDEVRQAHSEYSYTLLKRITQFACKRNYVGINFVLLAKIDREDAFGADVRLLSTARFSFRIENQIASFFALGTNCLPDLLSENDIMVRYKNKVEERLIPFMFSRPETRRICDFLKTQEIKNFLSEQYEKICKNHLEGALLAKDRQSKRKEFLIKEILKICFMRENVNPSSLKFYLSVPREELQSVLDILEEKKYLERTGVEYKLIITKEDFKKIFGENI